MPVKRRRRPSKHVAGILRTSKRRGWVKTCRKMQKDLCYWCKKPLGDDATAEHLIPLSKGGEDAISNVVAAHARCNHAKGDMMPEEYQALLAGKP